MRSPKHRSSSSAEKLLAIRFAMHAPPALQMAHAGDATNAARISGVGVDGGVWLARADDAAALGTAKLASRRKSAIGFSKAARGVVVDESVSSMSAVSFATTKPAC
ncbi:hypothetical protein BCR44DRAFT_1446572 [Catenaria anguillulae PL171]|uniref:Uncharacterized protein n=1 Tax=Catenaria anguillulae PL171 TaxID=765915 RepID=A0A1Y2H613_9FUNG|nr:hypothetical protein BCR44DRAFT_1446572 [Catenaria anguillulae PL171]